MDVTQTNQDREPANLANLPAEIRLEIWKLVIPQLHYDRGRLHPDHCCKVRPVTKDWRLLSRFEPPCECYKYCPLPICRSFKRGIQPIYDSCPIIMETIWDPFSEANFVEKKYWSRIREIKVKGEHLVDFLTWDLHEAVDFACYPNLRVITECTWNPWDPFVIFPRVTYRHLEQRLRNPDAIELRKASTLYEATNSDREVLYPENRLEELKKTIKILRNYNVQIKAACWYLVKISKVLGWPFHGDPIQIMTLECCSEFVWGKDGPQVLNTPDLREFPWHAKWAKSSDGGDGEENGFRLGPGSEERIIVEVGQQDDMWKNDHCDCLPEGKWRADGTGFGVLTEARSRHWSGRWIS